MDITASMVKELRDKTGAGMMDCKAALAETGGDFETAIDWLRKKGLSRAAKKAGRVAAEGLIGVASGGNAGALVEVNAETDFVAKNDQFKQFVKRAAELALEEDGDLQKLLKRDVADGATVEHALTQLISTIGENLSVRRSIALAVEPGVVASYVHNATSPELGKIGVLVALKSKGDKARLVALGRQIAMHVAAASPLALKPEHLPKEIVERERKVQADAARQSGKPENVIEKMIEGRMRKYYEETVLLHQIFVIDQETTVAKVIEKCSKELGTPVEIDGYVRFQVGEGIEKIDSDFADEVRKLTE
jgi:elongation factor Ts